MDSHDSGIDEKLVPFVEGALAEADRREVLQALPQQPSLNQEVRQLREIIMTLRNQSAQGLTYRSPVESPPDQVVDYALQSEQWSRTATRQFQLQLLESPDLANEIAILRELEQELQQPCEAPAAIPEMPAALRGAIQDAYGRSAPEPAWKKSLAAVFAWVATLNIRLVGAAVAGVTVVVAGVGFGRYAHQQLGTPAATVGMASPTPEVKTEVAAAAPAASPALPGQQVALLKDKVLPEDLPHLSRLLWEKQVSHSYREGQIFVAQSDVERAWAALNLNEKLADATPLKTKPAPGPGDKKDPLAGMVGMAPESIRKKVESPSTSKGDTSVRPTAAKTSPVAPASQPAPAAVPGIAFEPGEPDSGGHNDEASPAEGFDANYNVVEERNRRAERPPATATSRPPVRAVSRQPVAPTRPAPPEPAAPPPEEEAAVAPPVQQMRQAPSQLAIPASKDNQKESQGMGSILRGNPEPARRTAPGRQQVAAQPEPVPAPVPPPAATRPQDNETLGYLPESQGAPKRQEDLEEPPAPGAVVVQAGAAEDAPRPNTVELKSRSSSANPLPSGGTAPALQGGMKPVPKLRERDGSQTSDKLSMSNSNFEVSGDAPYEVAMLPVVKKLIEDQIGEARVQMERKDDGNLLITIRPARTLNPQEVEKLRKFVRKKLELKDEDTVVIRQP